MGRNFDSFETRSADARLADIAVTLPDQIAHAQLTGFGDILAGVNPAKITSLQALADLPILRKSDLTRAQADSLPMGGFARMDNITHVFQSPGPIYEVGKTSHDWWRFGRFLAAAGVTDADIVQNCFSYHFTPAGMMFENAAAAVGAKVFPAGTGQTEQQARVAVDIGTTVYAGTPDFLKAILERGDALGLDLSALKTAVVSGGPLFPQLRSFYADRGITCLQCYATADLGHIAYETIADEPMILDEGVLVEIVTPGTGNPVPDGEIGEVVVTTLTKEYPLIRFATGDMSSIVSGQSSCGRTNRRISGWKGRADQATKVKGMFVRPEQVADLVASSSDIHKARVEITHDGSTDQMAVKLETAPSVSADFTKQVKTALKLKCAVELVPVGSLPNDGLVIQDRRDHG